MSYFRLKPGVMANLLAMTLLAMTLFVSGAEAQTSAGANDTDIYPESDGGPISIVPGGSLTKKPGIVIPEKPLQAVPGSVPTNIADNDNDESEKSINDGAVLAMPLNQLDPASMGTITAENGGFRREFWAGSKISTILPLLKRLPTETRSPATRYQITRLLLSELTPPQGRIADEPNAYLRARIAQLAEIGALPGMAALFNRLPPLIEDDVLSRHRVDIALLSGNLRGACATAGDANQLYDDLYWLRVVAFCRVVEGDIADANFKTDMLRDMGDRDLGFHSLMQYLSLTEEQRTNSRARLTDLGDPTPLKLAMLRVGNMRLPSEMLARANSLMLRAVATMPNLSVDLRLEAAQMAARAGALDAATLASIYGGVMFDESELSNATAMLEAGMGARGNALVYQVARRSPDGAIRAGYLKTAWQLGRALDFYLLLAQTNIAATRALQPNLAQLDIAGATARALLASSDTKAAMGWYNLLRGEASNGQIKATTDLIALWPIMSLAADDGSVPQSPEILELWWQAQTIHIGAVRAMRGGLVFSLFEAMGRSVPPKYWRELMVTGPSIKTFETPTAAIMRGLNLAARRGRRGETMLLALVALGDVGPANADPAVLAQVVAALRKVGMNAEAKSFALEAVLGRGL